MYHTLMILNYTYNLSDWSSLAMSSDLNPDRGRGGLGYYTGSPSGILFWCMLATIWGSTVFFLILDFGWSFSPSSHFWLTLNHDITPSVVHGGQNQWVSPPIILRVLQCSYECEMYLIFTVVAYVISKPCLLFITNSIHVLNLRYRPTSISNVLWVLYFTCVGIR